MRLFTPSMVRCETSGVPWKTLARCLRMTNAQSCGGGIPINIVVVVLAGHRQALALRRDSTGRPIVRPRLLRTREDRNCGAARGCKKPFRRLDRPVSVNSATVGINGIEIVGRVRAAAIDDVVEVDGKQRRTRPDIGGTRVAGIELHVRGRYHVLPTVILELLDRRHLGFPLDQVARAPEHCKRNRARAATSATANLRGFRQKCDQPRIGQSALPMQPIGARGNVPMQWIAPRRKVVTPSASCYRRFARVSQPPENKSRSRRGGGYSTPAI